MASIWKNQPIREKHGLSGFNAQTYPHFANGEKKNIVFAGLLVGSGTPNWKRISVKNNCTTFWFVHNSLLQSSFSYYWSYRQTACVEHDQIQWILWLTLLYRDGKTTGRTHAYYTFTVEAHVRQPEATLMYAREAERADENIFGVKRRSALSELGEILPLAAPVVYIHCVFLGVFPEVLKWLLWLLTPSVREQVNKTVLTMNCPS